MPVPVVPRVYFSSSCHTIANAVSAEPLHAFSSSASAEHEWEVSYTQNVHVGTTQELRVWIAEAV